MARRKREPMSEGKKNIIAELIEEYDIRTAKDIEDALRDLMGGMIQEMLEAELDEQLTAFLQTFFRWVGSVHSYQFRRLIFITYHNFTTTFNPVYFRLYRIRTKRKRAENRRFCRISYTFGGGGEACSSITTYLQPFKMGKVRNCVIFCRFIFN